MSKILTTPGGKVLKTAAGKILTKPVPPPGDYLCFTAQEAGSTVGMVVVGTPTQGQAFQYSVSSSNNSSWLPFIPGTTTITLSAVGDKVYFKGNNTTVSESTEVYYKFVMTGKITGSGNIMSLLDETCQSTTVTHDFCFFDLFYNCESLISSLNIPATTLTESCYRSMFQGCTSLTTAPALPATTLAESCYCYMFYGCTSLTTAPELPATTLAESCYRSMFYGCTSLQVSDTQTSAAPYAWKMPTSGTFTNTYPQSRMFNNCAGTRSSDDMPGAQGQSYTYYTQNPPVS